jgi:hypothetical protein
VRLPDSATSDVLDIVFAIGELFVPAATAST